MEKGLTEITQLQGVAGAFVTDGAGQIIATSSAPTLATAGMLALALQTNQALAAVQAAGVVVGRVEFLFDRWRLFVRDLGPCAVICYADADIDAGMLRLTVDMVVSEWRIRGKDQRVAKGNTSRTSLLAKDQLDEPSIQSLRLLIAGT
jgi:hypothetical protein